jgi:hypothetical protein
MKGYILANTLNLSRVWFGNVVFLLGLKTKNLACHKFSHSKSQLPYVWIQSN